MKQKLKNFSKKISSGLHQEYHETKQIPSHIKNKNFKEVTQQLADIGKMVILAFIWILPAGAIVSGFIVKYSNRMRPTSFQTKKIEEDL